MIHPIQIYNQNGFGHQGWILSSIPVFINQRQDKPTRLHIIGIFNLCQD